MGFGAGQCPLVPSSAAHIRQLKAESTNGRPRLPLEATYNQKAHPLQPDMKSGFFPQLTWLIEGEAWLFRSEVWQAGEAGNPEKNESVKQWLLPALATSSAWKEGGGVGESPDARPRGPARVQEFGSVCLVYKQNTCVCVLWMAQRFLKLRGSKGDSLLLLEEARSEAASLDWLPQALRQGPFSSLSTWGRWFSYPG